MAQCGSRESHCHGDWFHIQMYRLLLSGAVRKSPKVPRSILSLRLSDAFHTISFLSLLPCSLEVTLTQSMRREFPHNVPLAHIYLPMCSAFHSLTGLTSNSSLFLCGPDPISSSLLKAIDPEILSLLYHQFLLSTESFPQRYIHTSVSLI